MYFLALALFCIPTCIRWNENLHHSGVIFPSSFIINVFQFHLHTHTISLLSYTFTSSVYKQHPGPFTIYTEPSAPPPAFHLFYLPSYYDNATLQTADSDYSSVSVSRN